MLRLVFLAILGSSVVALATGCASPTDSFGEGGSGGSGGQGGSGASGTTTGQGTGGTTSSTTSSTTTSTSTGTTGCPPMQHLCGGVCVGNTPATGCFNSTTCAACTTPANGTATCTANGDCDVLCDTGYTKMGLQCTCQAQCCSDTDCAAGETCMNGTCQASQTCDMTACVAMCLLQMKIGLCIGNTCVCQ